MTDKQLAEMIAENKALKAQVRALQKRKKYGLVWETWKTHPEKQEQVVMQCLQELPVLTHVADRDIMTDPSQPTHILIEGDNYHALSSLYYTHKGSIDVIYIDPPYNTGKKNEWKYNDGFVDKEDQFRHSKWLNMIAPRLRLAKDLVKRTGVVFISIDNNELGQLKVLCDDIFGEINLLDIFIRDSEGNIDNQKKIKSTHEYVLCYAKHEPSFIPAAIIDPNVGQHSKLYRDYIENSIIKNGPKNPISIVTLPVGFPCQLKEGIINKSHSRSKFPILHSDIIIEDGKLKFPVIVESGRSSKSLLEEFISNDCQFILDSKGQETLFEITNTGAISVYKKRSENQSHILTVLSNFGTTKQASSRLLDLGITFNFPKPVNLISYLCSLVNGKSSKILDFFAGSGTTGHAVAQLNAQDGGTRQAILVTNNEGNICTDVTYPRLSKVIHGYTTPKGKQISGLGGNLQYYKTDFVPNKTSDHARRQIVMSARDMLALVEQTQTIIIDQGSYIICSNHDHSRLMVIVFEEDAIQEMIAYICTLPATKHISIYQFSYTDQVNPALYIGLPSSHKLKAVPDALLKTYRAVFAKTQKILSQ